MRGELDAMSHGRVLRMRLSSDGAELGESVNDVS